MWIDQLTLFNFRNFPQTLFDFSPGITLILGRNAAGKSNLLEAISLLSLGFSPRVVESEGEWVATGKEYGRVVGKIGHSFLEVRLVKKKDESYGASKSYWVNGAKKRLEAFLGHFYTVLFSPSDLNLVSGAPDLRRAFLDRLLVQTTKGYASSRTEYEKVLRGRNHLLRRIKEGTAKKEDLEYWDGKLCENGRVLFEARKGFFEFLGRNCSSGHRFSYRPSVLDPEVLKKSYLREVEAGFTLHGPHRDDFLFFQDDRNLMLYGSRGEQRLVVFELKRQEVEFIRSKVDETPVLLLDDIFSELDHEHRLALWPLLIGGQVIVTTTDRHLVETEKEIKEISLNGE